MGEMEDLAGTAALIAQRYGPVAGNEVMAAGPAHAEDLARFAELLPILDEATYVVVASDAIVMSARAASTQDGQHLHARVAIVHAEAVRRNVAAGHAPSCQGVRLYALAYRRAVRDAHLDPSAPPLPDCSCAEAAAVADRRQAPRPAQVRGRPLGVAAPSADPPMAS